MQVAQLAGIPPSVISLAEEKGLELEAQLKASSLPSTNASLIFDELCWGLSCSKMEDSVWILTVSLNLCDREYGCFSLMQGPCAWHHA